MSRAHMPPETWERFTNDPWGQRQEAVQVEKDEFELLRKAAGKQHLGFRVAHGRIYVGCAEFADNERGVNEAWEYLDEGGSAA